MLNPDQKINEDFDTVVIGGGVVGLCLTWFLAEEGAAVVCLDDGRNAGSTANAGSLHGQMQSRMELLFPERVADYESTLSIYPRAIDYWSEVVQWLDVDVEFHVGGGLMVAESRKQMDGLAEKSRRESANGVDTSLLGKQELLRLAPYLNREVQGALFCPKEGKVNPLLANAAICRKALEHGGVLQRDAHVERIESTGRSYTVASNRGQFRAGRVVIAAGAGSADILATLGFYLPTAAEPLHMNITDATSPFMRHLVQHADQPLTMKQLKTGQLLIGGGWPAREGHDGGVPEVLLDSLLGNLGLAQHLVPDIADLRVTRTWAGINTMVDLLSVLGEIKPLPGVFVAIPGDAGYTLGPYCARLVVDQMSGRSPDYSLEYFSPSRFEHQDTKPASKGARVNAR